MRIKVADWDFKTVACGGPFTTGPKPVCEYCDNFRSVFCHECKEA